MSDQTPEGQAATPELRGKRRALRDRFSIVWLIPILALAVSLYMVWRTYEDQGPLIEVAFSDASGVRADETQLRYRDVVVGLVESVRFSDDLDEVIVEIRVEKNIARYIDAESTFWVVKPEVSAQGVSGLDTVLSGVYLAADWDGEIGTAETSFRGASSAPLVQYGQSGVTFQLRGQSVEGLSAGTQIFYRGIAVGQIANLRLGDDGNSVVADAFVREPEASRITTSTRFWDTSGFNFSFGAQGAQLSVDSIASLLTGGISFETTVSGGDAVMPDTVFRLYGDEETARSSVYANASDGEPVNLSIVFAESVPGLEVGADVDFGGIVVGRVASITGLLDEARFGDRDVRLLTTIEIEPSRLGLPAEATEDEVYDFFDFAVRTGLRAQLQTASLLGGLQIALVQLDETDDATLNTDAEPYPQIPSIPADLSDFADTAQGVFNRVNDLPIEELLDNAIAVMASVNSLLSSDGVTESPEQVLGILTAVRGIVSSDGVQSLPDQIGTLMGTVNDTAADLQAVVASLDEAGAVEQLVAALDAAEDAANAVFVAVDDVPATLTEINTAVVSLDELISSINVLPLDRVVAEVEGTVAATRAILEAPATQGLTGNVASLLGESEALIQDIRASGLIETTEATLLEVQNAVAETQGQIAPLLAEARNAVANTDATLNAIPGVLDSIDTLTRDLDTLVGNVTALPLDETVGNANDLLASVDLLVGRVETQELPGEVNQTLASARQVMAALVAEGGTLDQAERTLAATETAVSDLSGQLESVLAAAQNAANNVSTATNQVPEVVARANAIAADIEELTAQASTIPVQELSDRVSSLVQSADALVSSEGTQRLPGALSDALNEVQRLLIQVQEGGLIDSANSTLASAERAADAIRQASDQLPALLSTTGALLTQTQAVIAGYEANGQLGAQVRSTLREVQQAAGSIDSLARQIERAPNSLLFGR